MDGSNDLMLHVLGGMVAAILLVRMLKDYELGPIDYVLFFIGAVSCFI